MLKRNKGQGQSKEREKIKTHGDRSRSLLNLGGLYLDSRGGGSLDGLDLLDGGNNSSSFRGRHYGRELVYIYVRRGMTEIKMEEVTSN